MKKNVGKHIWYYGSFIAIQLLGLALVLSTAYDKQLQMMTMFITTFFYIFWSLLHQHMHHHLNAKIVTEYVLMGSLGITISLLFFNT